MPIAGCTDLMVRGPEALHRMDRVIDLLGVPELRGIREVDGGLEIGATTSFSEIRSSAAVRAAFPILAEAAALVGGWQIQNRATLGGNMANASPAGDSLPVLLALDAIVVAAGAGGLARDPLRRIPRRLSQDGPASRRDRRPRPPSLPAGGRGPGLPQGRDARGAIDQQGGRRDGRPGGGRKDRGAPPRRRQRRRHAGPPARHRGGRPRPAAGPEAADLAGREAAREVTPIDDVRSTADYRRFALERVVRRLMLTLTTEQEK